MCKRKNKNEVKKINQIDQEHTFEESDNLDLDHVAIETICQHNEIEDESNIVKLEINTKLIKCKIDSGAKENLISLL
jgi:hypothetical protein